MENEKVYCTKYVLTRGIEVYEKIKVNGAYTFVKDPKGYNSTLLLANSTLFATEEEAQADAQERVAKQITRLSKQLEKLNSQQGQPFSVTTIS